MQRSEEKRRVEQRWRRYGYQSRGERRELRSAEERSEERRRAKQRWRREGYRIRGREERVKKYSAEE